MEYEAATIDFANKIIDAIMAFKEYKSPDNVVVSRVYHLCVFEKRNAQLKIDMKLDAMEKEMIGK